MILKAWAAEAFAPEFSLLSFIIHMYTHMHVHTYAHTHRSPDLEAGDWGNKHLCGHLGCVSGVCASSHVPELCVSLSVFIHDSGYVRVGSTLCTYACIILCLSMSVYAVCSSLSV